MKGYKVLILLLSFITYYFSFRDFPLGFYFRAIFYG